MEINTLIEHGIFYGLILSVFFSIILLAAVYVNVEIMQNDYPPDVKKAYGPEKNPNTRNQRRIFSLLFLAALFGVIGFSIVDTASASPAKLTFLPLFVLLFFEIFTFNVWDLLVIDWLIFNTSQPKFILLPGTEGLPGYKDYFFHFKGFLTGIAFSLVSALVLAGMSLIIINALG